MNRSIWSTPCHGLKSLLLLTLVACLLQGCAVTNEVPERAAPIGAPTNPPPPRLEAHHHR